MSNSNKIFTHSDYNVGWICALPTELTAARYMLDEVHEGSLTQDAQDTNIYARGKVHGHNVVIACLTTAGIGPAAVAATQMLRTYKNVKFGLMVGIGGGAPRSKHDIRLGDIVVSAPTKEHSGVVQIDFGAMVGTGVEGFKRHSTSYRPPEHLINAINSLMSTHEMETPKYNLYLSESELRRKAPKMASTFIYQGTENDQLFKASYRHRDEEAETCDACDASFLVPRNPRHDMNDELDLTPTVHYGNIGSANNVMRDSETRDWIARKENILAFEMEAAGLMNNFPCLVIRGICDYADSHKNKKWQRYAALVAAAYAKELLSVIPLSAAKTMPSISSRNAHYLMPRHSNTLFTGRRSVLERMKAAICGPTNVNLPHQRRFVIHGMGGAGKSEVCIRFAEENREQFWGIFWIDAFDTTSAHRSFASIAKECGTGEETLDSVKRWFSNCEYEWLFIIDNADNVRFDYSKYFPAGNRGRILLTSRNQECTYHGTVGSEYFEKLDKEDAFELLSKAAGISQQLTEERSKAITDVLDILGYHALALIQAGAFIKKQLCSVEEYPAQYKKQRETLLTFRPQQTESTYGDVYATFEVSAQVLKSSTKQEDSDALELLGLLGFFNFQDVQELMFQRAWDFAKVVRNGYDNNYSERSKESNLYDPPERDVELLSEWHVSHLPRLLGDLSSDSIDITRFRQARNTLASFSLIRVDQNTGNISLHPLAHSWSKDRLHSSERNESLCAAASVLALSTGQDFLPYSDFVRNLHIHAECCLNPESQETLRSINVQASCQIFYRAAWVFLRADRDLEALHFFTQICDALGFDFNVLSRKTQSSHIYCQHLASVCETRLDNPRRAVVLLEALYNHTDHGGVGCTPFLQHALGRTYSEIGEYGKAISILEDVVASDSKKLDKYDEQRLIPVHTLASAYLEVNRKDEAIKLLEEVVALRNEVLNDQHPQRFTSHLVLAQAYQKADQPYKAVELLETIVAIQAKNFSAQHKDRLKSECGLASAYLHINQPQKAVEILERVVAIRADILNAQDPDRLETEHKLASAYLDLNQSQKAVDILEPVVKIRADILNTQDQARLSSEYELAKGYLSTGRPREAVALFEKVVEIQKNVLPRSHSELNASQERLADAYMDLDPPEVEQAKMLWEIVAANGEGSSHESSLDTLAANSEGGISEVGSEEQDGTYRDDSNSETKLYSRGEENDFDMDGINPESANSETPQSSGEASSTNGGKSNRNEFTIPKKRKRDAFEGSVKGRR